MGSKNQWHYLKNYCSLILKAIFSDSSHHLIFKGGTLLNKVHVGFYRLSEDLDFSVSIPEGTSRKTKSSLMESIKTILNDLVSDVDEISFRDPFSGHNSSSLKTPYNRLYTKLRTILRYLKARDVI